MSSLETATGNLTAYQRWELHSFDAPRRGDPDVMPPTAEGLGRIYQQSHDEGYAAGYREGSGKAAQEAERLSQIVAALTQSAQAFDQRLAEGLLGLAVTISRQVLQQALALRPEAILTVVNDVLGQLPLAHQRAHLMLHPEDAALVRQNLGELLSQTGWQIIESAQISRGGCRLEATECSIDATLESRWQRVVTTIGGDHVWIE